MTPRLSFDASQPPQSRAACTLPPLILHPFADASGPGKLVESSRASLKLQGLLPSGESSREDLDRALLDGRFSELRMLFYVGKDLARWIEQCLEFAERNRQFLPAGTSYQSFAAMLVDAPPKCVSEKLISWGVSDQRTIFSRAIGLRSAFADLPSAELLSPLFLKNYHRYADHLFACYQRLSPFTLIGSDNFPFELYGSEEYSRKLSEQFERQ